MAEIPVILGRCASWLHQDVVVIAYCLLAEELESAQSSSSDGEEVALMAELLGHLMKRLPGLDVGIADAELPPCALHLARKGSLTRLCSRARDRLNGFGDMVPREYLNGLRRKYRLDGGTYLSPLCVVWLVDGVNILDRLSDQRTGGRIVDSQ